MTTSFITNTLARQAAERAEMSARHDAELEADVVELKASVCAQIDGIVIRARGSAVSSKSGKTAPAPRAKNAKRTPEELEELTKAVRNYIAKHPDQRIEQIAPGLGDVTTKELVLPLKKLIAEKAVVTRGQKRATSYRIKG